MIDFSRVKVKYGKGNFCKSNRGLEKKKEKKKKTIKKKTSLQQTSIRQICSFSVPLKSIFFLWQPWTSFFQLLCSSPPPPLYPDKNVFNDLSILSEKFWWFFSLCPKEFYKQNSSVWPYCSCYLIMNSRMFFFFYVCTASGVQSSAVTKEDLVVSYRDPVSFQRSKSIQNAYMEVGDPMQDLDTWSLLTEAEQISCGA